MNLHGIGLGLHISKLIVEAFQGKITFTSEYGVGSNFTFTFKLNSKGSNSSSIIDLTNKKDKFDIDNPKLHFYWRPNNLQNVNSSSRNINYTLNLYKDLKED